MILIRFLVFSLILTWIVRLLFRSVAVTILRTAATRMQNFRPAGRVNSNAGQSDFRQMNSAGTQTAVADPFKILGVAPQMPLKAVKERYLELVDKTRASFVARGFSESDAPYLEELERLRFAYQAITESRI